jgi:DNA topoisomerase VI subunit A
MDGDISRFNILVCYKNGSAKMSYESENLTTLDIYWLGVRPSDIVKYNISQKYTKFLSERELIDVQNMPNKPYVRRHSSWVKELELMLETRIKIDLMETKVNWIAETYLPSKLQNRDWRDRRAMQ